MSEPHFLKSEYSDLYYLPGASEETGLQGFQCVYLPPAGKLPPSPLALSVSWELPGGIYLFLNAKPAEEEAFVATIRKHYAGPNRSVRFLWLTDPNLPLARWAAQYVEADGSGKVTKLVQLRFRNYRLVISANAQMSLSGPDVPAGIVFRQPPGVDRWCYWQSGSGTSVYVTEPSVRLPITGNQLGCVTFPLALNGQVQGPDELDALDIGIRYYYDHPDYPGYLQSLRYRVFHAHSLRLNACVDPIHPLLGSRTCFSIAAGEVLDTYYTTWTGKPVQVQPASEGEAKLVFAVLPSALTETDADSMTLVPSGTFELLENAQRTANESGNAASALASESDSRQTATLDERPVFRLMLGLSALEYAGSSAAIGNRLHFVPGQPAYAPGFTGKSGDGEGLKDNALTAYIYVTSHEEGAAAYYSQPEKSVLYELGAASSAANPVTAYMEVAVRPLPELTRAEQAFPAVPYGHLHGLPNAEQYVRFEKKVLSSARQLRMLQAVEQPGQVLAEASEAQQQAARLGVTRKGWLAKFNRDATAWQSLVLAQAQQGNEMLELAGPGGGAIRGPLQEALYSNQLFLVAEGSKFAQHAELLTSLLTIEGFSFELNPAKWAAAGTILILKYRAGSLKELAANLDAWTMASSFNEGGLTQLRLQRMLESAEDMAETHVEFQSFAELLNNPGWTGLLALNVHTPLEQLPPELAGLRGGIDAADFKAHHFGIHSSPVLVQGGNSRPPGIRTGTADILENGMKLANGPAEIRLKDSSMFGLIYYDDDTPMQLDGSVYRYRVKTLKVQFENSAIKSFSSSVELLLGRLFGDSIALQGATEGQNIIPFHGVYQEVGGRKTYVFLHEQELSFRVNSEVLEEVELHRAQFMTETTTEEQQAGRDIESRFAFWGNLRFKYRSEFDLFSFGNGPNGEEGHLSFANLALHMRFAQAEPDNKRFAFDAGNLSLNVASSKARTGSLFRHFPLKLTGFIQAEEGSSPKSLGYHSVQTPISETALRQPWYGLEFELNLGSLGALASSAGFAAKLLAAWSPSDGGGISMFTGMYIPGTGDSGKMFALENILHFSIDTFRMEVGKSASGHPSYTLILSSLRMNFLGLQFPSGAYVDFVLFGNPDPNAQADSLGWYASYLDEGAKMKGTKTKK